MGFFERRYLCRKFFEVCFKNVYLLGSKEVVLGGGRVVGIIEDLGELMGSFGVGWFFRGIFELW